MGLFTYLLILNAGLLVLAYFRSWRLLNLLAFIFTVLLYGLWLGTKADAAIPKTYTNALWFGTAFYLMFFFINLAHNIKENKKFIASDFGILLANTGLYFGAGLYCLTMAGLEQYRGLFSALLAVFNLVSTFILFRNKKVDSNILYLLIGLTLTFISVTAPVQLQGNYITLFWTCETVLLYWLFQKSKIAIIRVSSLLIWGAMLISLFMDWSNIYFSYSFLEKTTIMAVVFNKGFLTTLLSSIGTFILCRLRLKDEKEQDNYSNIIPSATVLALLPFCFCLALGLLK